MGAVGARGDPGAEAEGEREAEAEAEGEVGGVPLTDMYDGQCGPKPESRRVTRAKG